VTPPLYSICDIPLPNSEYTGKAPWRCSEHLAVLALTPICKFDRLRLGRCAGFDEESIAAALGWVCHFVLLLANNYDVPMPYPITPMGSRSVIREEGVEYGSHHRAERQLGASVLKFVVLRFGLVGVIVQVPAVWERLGEAAVLLRRVPTEQEHRAGALASPIRRKRTVVRLRADVQGSLIRPRQQLLTARGVIMQDLRCTLPNLYLLISHEAEVQARQQKARRQQAELAAE